MHNDWIIKEDVNKLTFQEDVLVLDKFIPETICKDIQDYAFNKAEWTYTNQSEGDNRSLHWGSSVVSYPNVKVKNWDEYIEKGKIDWEHISKKCPAIEKFWKFLKEKSPVRKYLPDTPTRSLLNCSTGGHGDISHLDSSGDLQVVTHILYLNEDLDVDDGGQTEFYALDRSEIVGAVSPKFGRVVILDGRIPHAGKAPWVHYTGRRITLGIQCSLVDENNKYISLKHENITIPNKLTRNDETFGINNKEFIREYNNIIPPDLCDLTIKTFDENKEEHRQGETFTKDGNEVDLSIKRAKELFLSNGSYPELRKRLLEVVTKAIQAYSKEFKVFESIVSDLDLSLEMCRIRKYEVGDYFLWHSDAASESTFHRVVAVCMYFNDVPEGGELEFKSGYSYKPKKGSILIFPCAWNNIHRSAKVISNPKYFGGTFLRIDKEEYTQTLGDNNGR